MKKAEEIFKNMREEMPWSIIGEKQLKPYILEAMKEYAIDYHESEVKKLHLQNVNGSAFVIMYQKKPLRNILFPSCDEARNYIKMQHPKRTFKEPKENVFVCSRYGTTFEIVELHYC